MSRRKLHNTLLITLVLVLAGAAFGWWYLASSRWPLKGDSRHDLGVVMIEDGRALATHTFHLTNGTNEAITIEGVRPSCGCLTTSVNREVVEPGEGVDVEVSYTQRRPVKRKKYHIDVIIRGFGSQPLWLEAGADGIPAPHPAGLIVQPTGLKLTPGVSAEVWLNAALPAASDSSPPPDPRIDTPPGVTTTFGGWRAINDMLPTVESTLEWRGSITVEWDGERDIPEGAVLRILVEPFEPKLVQLEGGRD